MRVLVVDASKEVRSRVVDAMSELDGVVIQGAVADLRDAVRALDATPLDTVITGVAFPDGDAVGLITAARRRRLSNVVVFAASEPQERKQRCLAAGASHFVDGITELTATMLRLSQQHVEGLDGFALVGRLAAGVAHDLDAHLAVALGSLALAEHAEMSDEARAELRRANRAFDGMARLSSSLTTYARGVTIPPMAIELGELVRTVLETFRNVIPEGVQVVIECESDLPKLRGVRSELEQLVLNLVINSCDAMPWGGKLWLIVERSSGQQVRLEITDTGSGVIEEIANGDGPTSPSARHGRQGGGLGLGIVRSVVDRHGGTLRIGRRNSGGTSIVVGLPTLT